MQGLIDKIFENKPLTFIAAVVALLLAGALVLFAVRLAFGRRVKAPGGGRTRLPRLGVVDAFDIDRQRQLVIIRRDNVEHLLMIGGPNDLVIESEIIRAEARERHREKEPREKDLREKEPALTSVAAPFGPGAAAAPALPPESEAVATRAPNPPPAWKAPIPPIAALAAATVGGELPAAAANEAGVPEGNPGFTPTGPARGAAFSPTRRPAPAAAIAPRPPREPLLRADPALRPESASAGAFQRASLATPFLRPPPPRQLAETLARQINPPAGPPAQTPPAEPPVSEQTTPVGAIEGAQPATLPRSADADTSQTAPGADQPPEAAAPSQGAERELAPDVVEAGAKQPAPLTPAAPLRASEPFDFVAAVAAALEQPEEAPLLAPPRHEDLAETPLAEARDSTRRPETDAPLDIEAPPTEKHANVGKSFASAPAHDSLEEELAKLLGRGPGGV
ncbi:hypothetical protein CR492_01410 [Methylocella silvestris]|uniref:Flagellar biosynthesis protein FliO n=2 Tax=Methylocella silvestris TaxID=199596 RepID=A0A2J7TLF0_METSI|nr:hypothetical protein CR492_01410 [Methylocella silvestris]